MDELNLPSTDAPFDAKSALCLGAMTIVAEDGIIEDEELRLLKELVHSDEDAFITAYSYFNEHSVKDCMDKVASTLSAEQKAAAFAKMVDIAHVDDDFAIVEQQLLDNYAGVFGLSIAKSNEIYRVVGMIRDFSLFKP
jgi:uncharacterized tellurite resistance protein B-like protein